MYIHGWMDVYYSVYSTSMGRWIDRCTVQCIQYIHQWMDGWIYMYMYMYMYSTVYMYTVHCISMDEWMYMYIHVVQCIQNMDVQYSVYSTSSNGWMDV